MGLSTKWNLNDNIYSLQRGQSVVTSKSVDEFNDGCCGLFETEHDGKVNRCIAEFAATHSRNETFLYNNRLYLGNHPRKQVHTDQYNTNRAWILKHFSK